MMRANTTVIEGWGGNGVEGWGGLEASPVTGGVEGDSGLGAHRIGTTSI